MLLPWEYGVRNLFRRPIRSLLTLAALATVIMLVFLMVGFIRGLEQSLVISGDSDVVLVYSVNSEESLDNSAIAARTPELLTSSLSGIVQRFGVTHISPEMYLAARVRTQDGHSGFGLVRGVKQTAPLVRRSVRLLEGQWPGPGEVMAGQLASTKLGTPVESLDIGRTIEMEGQAWRVSGTFAAGGSGYESELWCNLGDLQTATKRQDLSLVAALLEPGASVAEIQLFCKQRNDLELRAIRETDYYASLQQYYRPVRMLAWVVVTLVAAAGVFAGMNMMYGAVSGRIRELAMLQAIGYRRRAILTSLVQEGVILAAAASLLAGAIALVFINGLAVRFTMGAFVLRVDGVAILIGCAVGLTIGVLGALPPALKALRQPVATALKAV